MAASPLPSFYVSFKVIDKQKRKKVVFALEQKYLARILNLTWFCRNLRNPIDATSQACLLRATDFLTELIKILQSLKLNNLFQ